MQLVEASNRPDPIERGLVADVATERIRRVGRIHDHAAAAHDVRGLREQPTLRMRLMHGKVLAHGDSASDLRLRIAQRFL